MDRLTQYLEHGVQVRDDAGSKAKAAFNDLFNTVGRVLDSITPDTDVEAAFAEEGMRVTRRIRVEPTKQVQKAKRKGWLYREVR